MPDQEHADEIEMMRAIVAGVQPRPMSTVPKDGRPVLIMMDEQLDDDGYDPARFFAIGEFHPDWWRYSNNPAALGYPCDSRVVCWWSLVNIYDIFKLRAGGGGQYDREPRGKPRP